MNRSLWKGIYADLNLYLIKKDIFGIPLYTMCRNTTILKKHYNYFFKVYNGLKYVPKMMNDNFIGHKLGEFSLTCKMGSKIHKQKFKNIKKNIKKK